MIGGACGTHGGDYNLEFNLVEKHERKIQFERHKRGWEDNIRVYLEAVWCDWTGLICGLL